MKDVSGDLKEEFHCGGATTENNIPYIFTKQTWVTLACHWSLVPLPILL